MSINGFLNIDKPRDWTSHDVVAKLRKILQQKKIGHAGTLDPFAVGVLPIALGTSTRLIRFLQKSKIYIAEIDFSCLTDTDDHTGTTLKDDDFQMQDLYKNLGIRTNISWTKSELEKALAKFVGKIEQIPPIYSARHHNGKKLYELARAGEQISLTELNSKEVHIKSIKLTEFEAANQEFATRAVVEIACSEGTYIRSIARDLGGHLLRLERLESNGLDIDQSISLEQLEQCQDNNERLNYVIPNSQILKLPKIQFMDKEILSLQQGQQITLPTFKEELAHEDYIQCFDSNDELIGIASIEKKCNDFYAQPKVVL